MQFTIQVNNKKIKAEKGETILTALNRNGIKIPTLCRMKDFTPTGACRMCVVEVEGRDRLVTACSQPVEEWMIIKTHSPRVIKARKTIVELLLSKHPDDCLYCERNLSCELQKLSEELNIRERRIKGKKVKQRLDQSSPAIVREFSKCILCGRCVRVCEEVITASTLDFINKGQQTHIGTAMDKDFNFSSCIHCGQCVQVCPTGALHEKHNITEVQENLSKSDSVNIIQYSPYAATGLAEELGVKPTRDFDRTLNAIFRRMGFSRVFTTGFATDILITELTDVLEGKELKESPLFISACPAWVKYAEQFLPDWLKNMSTLKSPQQIAGSLIRTLVADQMSLKSQQIYSVSVTPCTAMKFEARRDGMMRKGLSDVDTVLTVREMASLIRLYGIDVASSGSEPADEPLHLRSSAAAMAEITGGLTESVLRTLYYRVSSKEPEKQNFKKIRTGGSFRENIFVAGSREYSVAVVDGLGGLEKLRASMKEGIKYDLVEVMACQGGCIHGAGLYTCTTREDIRNRAKYVISSEENEAVSLPLRSPAILNLYEKLIPANKSLADKSLFHTHFSKRELLL